MRFRNFMHDPFNTFSTTVKQWWRLTPRIMHFRNFATSWVNAICWHARHRLRLAHRVRWFRTFVHDLLNTFSISAKQRFRLTQCEYAFKILPLHGSITSFDPWEGASCCLHLQFHAWPLQCILYYHEACNALSQFHDFMGQCNLLTHETTIATNTSC